jgi:hypothetical protein
MSVTFFILFIFFRGFWAINALINISYKLLWLNCAIHFSSHDPAKRKLENEQVKIAGAQSEYSLISGTSARSLKNKTSPKGDAERSLRNKMAGARSKNTLLSGGGAKFNEEKVASPGA